MATQETRPGAIRSNGIPATIDVRTIHFDKETAEAATQLLKEAQQKPKEEKGAEEVKAQQ